MVASDSARTMARGVATLQLCRCYRWIDGDISLLADVVLTLHFSIVAFVVGGLIVTIIGNLSAWRWVNALWFRLAHLAAIAVVVAQAWFGATCPLTSLEMWLRANADAATYRGSFIEHWLQRLLYYEAPSWVFTLGYSLFGLVAATWCGFTDTKHSGMDRSGKGKARPKGVANAFREEKRRLRLTLPHMRDQQDTGSKASVMSMDQPVDADAGRRLRQAVLQRRVT